MVYNLSTLNISDFEKRNENRDEASAAAAAAFPPSPPSPPPHSLPPLSPPPPPPPPSVAFGIVGADSTMQDHFSADNKGLGFLGNDTDDAGSDIVEMAFNGSAASQLKKDDMDNFRIHKFEMCPLHMREYIPCMDNKDAIHRLHSTLRGQRFERHCPDKSTKWCCLIPTPPTYKTPIPWPKSRDKVWYSNVPHTRLVDDKGGGLSWIRINSNFQVEHNLYMVLNNTLFRWPGWYLNWLGVYTL